MAIREAEPTYTTHIIFGNGNPFTAESPDVEVTNGHSPEMPRSPKLEGHFQYNPRINNFDYIEPAPGT